MKISPRERIMIKVKLTLSLLGLILFGSSSLSAQTVPPAPTDRDAPHQNDNKDEPLNLDTFVVTGVFQGTKKEEATVAISTISSRDVEPFVPASAAELLSNAAGVFVDSSHGEIRNIVYSRGVSANSLDGATGYYYVAMEEDGLPVTNMTWVNFGPDYFLRADVNLDRLEAVRGGAAAVTGPNAPGGIFNYISRTGTNVASGEVRLKYGLEGDGRNPYHRGDVWLGGPLGRGWTYSLGGFYRRADGSQHPRFPMNDGGQIKLNLTKETARGLVQFYGKYLREINGFANFIPGLDFNDPHPAPGWENHSNPTPPPAVFNYQTDANRFARFDSRRQQLSTSKVIGLRTELNFGDGWNLGNNLKYSDSRSVWNSWIGILPQSLTDVFTRVYYGILVTPGTYTFRDTITGASAHVLQTGPLTATLQDSTLPGAHLATGYGIAQLALDLRPGVKEVMDQVSLTKKMDRMTFTLGAFVSLSDAESTTTLPGFGLTTLEPDSHALGVSVVTPAGQTLQVTNPQGFGAPLSKNANRGTWDQTSVFFGHRWDVAKDWTLDWGVRGEYLDVEARNVSIAGNPPPVVSTTGGVDGNTATHYDNTYTPDPTSFVTFGKTMTSTSYSAALYRRIDRRQSVYLRFSDGKKAPDMAIFFAQNDPNKTQFANTSLQEVQQVELGYKYVRPRLFVSVTPYFSILKNVRTTSLFNDTVNGLPTLTPRYASNELRAYGVELEGNWAFENGFATRAAVTWQHSEATKWFVWTSLTSLNDLSGGRAENNPNLMATITPSYTKGRLYLAAQWKYLGSRAANAANAFTLPAFDTTNLNAKWQVDKRFSVGLTVNNVFNSAGVMAYTVPGTNFVAELNRQSLTAQQVQANPGAFFTVLPVQPRAYFLSLDYKY